MTNPDPASGASVGSSQDEYVLSLGDLLQVLWRRLWIIALSVVLLTAASVGYSMGQTPIYQASIKILVGQEQRASEVPSQLGSDVMGLQQLTLTVSEAVATRPVANGVIERLDLNLTTEQFLQNLSVEQIGTTQFIQVSYSDPDPERARRVADTVGEVFSEQVSEVSPNANSITATLWERAAVPGAPSSPDILLNALLALVLGLMLGFGLAVLLEYLDDSWRSSEEVEQASGVPTFGLVPQFKVPRSDKGKSTMRLNPLSTGSRNEKDDLSGRLITTTDPTSVAAEAYRTLRTNLLYALVDNPPRVIVMTSPGPQEGKSTTCANLGVVLAQADKRTLIVDCDLRKPVVHKVFGLRNISGVVDVLVGQHRIQEIWQEPMPGLKVLPVGPIPPNPAELLGSRRFASFLAGVREQFDYVLIDAPPIGLVSDPAVLATQGDGTLLVLDAQKTRKTALRESMRGLEAVGANVLGTVMNNMKKGKGGYYGYKYE